MVLKFEQRVLEERFRFSLHTCPYCAPCIEVVELIEKSYRVPVRVHFIIDKIQEKKHRLYFIFYFVFHHHLHKARVTSFHRRALH